MDIRKLQHVVIDALEDLKGQQISAFNTTGLTQLFDRVYIVTGTSNRHTRSLAASVRDKVKSAGGSIVSVEGEEAGEWVLVDLGDAVVHIMQPAIRAYYNLEELWGAKPVAAHAADGGARKTGAKRAPTKRAPTKSGTAKAAPAKGSGARTAARNATEAKGPAKRAPAKKAAGKRAVKKPAH